ncbi:MAG: hypothetical protein V7K77_15030 [Nostoc sp.]|uniref:hypothetical protein n=1 Tax=Nostoc sp. TaxID=1180 RepID=UPI002FF8B931
MNLKIFALVLATLMGISAKTIAQTWDRSAPGDFQGRYLVSVSDADMLASAYVDGKESEVIYPTTIIASLGSHR